MNRKRTGKTSAEPATDWKRLRSMDYSPLIEEFKKAGQMPLLWQWTAREFVCSANILRRAAQDTDLFPPGGAKADHLWKPHRVVLYNAVDRVEEAINRATV